MFTISKGLLKAKMLEYLRRVEQTQEELIITDHNKPVLKIVPYRPTKLPTEVFKTQGKVIYHEDLNRSTTDEWPEL